MATILTKPAFLADLRVHIHHHVTSVQNRFQELDDALLNQQPTPAQWSVLQCFDHLNLTHNYYRRKIGRALIRPTATAGEDLYGPSFWGRIYMHFAFNPQKSFPTPPQVIPSSSALGRNVFEDYLTKQSELLELLAQVDAVDLRRTPIPIVGIVRFNLGDCFKVLVYHDGLHVGQAERVLTALGHSRL